MDILLKFFLHIDLSVLVRHFYYDSCAKTIIS